MKLLVILISNKMDKLLISNIQNLKEQMNLLIPKCEIDYAGISSEDDFINYEEYITFKYKFVNPKKQISKLNDFISNFEDKNYDWYIKIRPEVYLLEPINLNCLVKGSINGRARKYEGCKEVPYGISVGGSGPWRNIYDVKFNDIKEFIELDDQIFIFDNTSINLNAFSNLHNYLTGFEIQNETIQTNIWLSNNAKLNIIPINMILDYRDGRQMWSGHIKFN